MPSPADFPVMPGSHLLRSKGRRVRKKALLRLWPAFKAACDGPGWRLGRYLDGGLCIQPEGPSNWRRLDSIARAFGVGWVSHASDEVSHE